jgi:hypothetical protein
MDLLDRYLNAVAKGLPEAQREDIIRELSEDICSEMEDKETQLRRPLTEPEHQAILKRRGNPALLAARFRQDHRSVAFGPQLIGPVLFPFYIKVLSFNLGLTFVVLGTIFLTLVVSGQNIAFQSIFSNVLLQLFIQLGAVTLIFSLIQRHLNKYPDSWNLRGMGDGVHLHLKFPSDTKSAKRTNGQVSRFESVSIIVASAVALVWLAEVRRHPFLLFGPAAYFLKLAPIWTQMYGPIVFLTSLGIVQAVINLFRPRWTRLRTLVSLFVQAAGLAILCLLLKAGSWVAVAGTAGSNSAAYSHAAELVNKGIFYFLLIAAAISVVQLALRIARLMRGQRNPSSLPSVDVHC